MVGAGEIFLIAGALVMIFGASQIPKIARSLGEGIKELKKAMKDVKKNDGEEVGEEVIEDFDKNGQEDCTKHTIIKKQ